MEAIIDFLLGTVLPFGAIALVAYFVICLVWGSPRG